jgi:hypothetical protein
MPTPRNSYTFKEGLTMMAAKAVGIDPYLAAEAGENARAAINAIRNAAKTKQPKDRAEYIREAHNEMRTISAALHPKLVNALQAKLLALQGRGRDTAVAHVEPGEMVIPRAMLTPEVMELIAAEAQRRGIDPRRLRVGGQGSINPATGAEEFGLFDAMKGWFGGDKDKLDMTGIDKPLTTTRRNSAAELESSASRAVFNDFMRGGKTQPSWLSALDVPEPESISKPLPSRQPNSVVEARNSGQEIHPYSPPQRRLPAQAPNWSGLRQKAHNLTNPMSDAIEPIDAVTSVTPIGRTLKRLEPLVDNIGHTANTVDIADRATAARPRPQSVQRSRGGLATAYRIADQTDNMAGDIAVTTGVMSWVPAWAPATAPIAGVSGATSGAAKLAKYGLRKYCKRHGLNDDCTN